MESNGQTLAMLQGIWNEMKTLNGRVNATNERLEQGFARVDEHLGALTACREPISRLEEHVGLPPTGR